MKEKLLTDNKGETIIIRWDGERFALMHQKRTSEIVTQTIILNPREMLDLVQFAGSCGEERHDYH